MNYSERRAIVTKASTRILNTLEAKSGYSRLAYLEKLVDMLDDVHLLALDFAIEMTPDSPPEQVNQGSKERGTHGQ